MKRNRLLLVIFSAAIFISACATASFMTPTGQTFDSRDKAWAASMRDFAEAEAAISSGPRPLVERKLLYVIPTASALLRTFEARMEKQGKHLPALGTPARAPVDHFIDVQVANFKSLTSSLRKANIYQEVLVQEVDSTESNIQPSPTQDTLSAYLGADGSGQAIYYFQNAKFGKQVVAVDMGKASISERRRSFIDEIKSKALQ